jgi:glutathione peroxidase
MKYLITSLFLCFYSYAQAAELNQSVDLDIQVRTLNDDQQLNLGTEYSGKVLLIVNTASKCGFTPQYEGLEKLYDDYKEQGLVVLGFPSNDFGQQEPGTEQEIKKFCRLTYGVRFPMFQKSSVTASNPDQLYQRLAGAAGEYPRWNFHKYLIDRQGRLVGSYKSAVKPEDPALVEKIKSLL